MAQLADFSGFDERHTQGIQKAYTTLFPNGGNNGNMGGMEARIAKLEAHIEHIKSDLSEIKGEIKDIKKDAKTDFRLLFGALITMALGLAALMAKGFGWLL